MNATTQNTPEMSSQEPELKRVNRPRSEKQQKIADAVEEHAIIKETGELNVDPVLDYLHEEHGEGYTSKGYIWQVVGQFFAVVIPQSGEQSFDEAAHWYQKGVRETLKSINENQDSSVEGTE